MQSENDLIRTCEYLNVAIRIEYLFSELNIRYDSLMFDYLEYLTMAEYTVLTWSYYCLSLATMHAVYWPLQVPVVKVTVVTFHF